MRAGAAIVLVHSPYAGPSTWLPVAACLRELGWSVAVPSFAGVALAPGREWRPFIDKTAEACPPGVAVVLAGHSGAGPLLPAIGAELGRRAAGYLFVDGTLPVDGYRRADSVPAAERQSASYRRAEASGELPNAWRSPATWAYVGLRSLGEELAAEVPRLPFALNEAPIAVPASWPSAPVAYLAFTPNPFYAPEVERARASGWLVEEMTGAHFHMLVDPPAVAGAVTRLADELLAGGPSHG